MITRLFLYYCKWRHFEGNIEIDSRTHLLLYEKSKIYSYDGKLKIGTDFTNFGGAGIDPRRDNCRIHMKNSTMVSRGDVSIYPGTRIVINNGELSIGNGTKINTNCEIYCSNRISIGKNCRFAPGVIIRDSDAHKFTYEEHNLESKTTPIYIEDDVWLGQQSMILKGVRIGKGSVVSARAVVTRDIPEHSLVAGVPAKVIKENIEWKI